jgi:TonB family protein
MKGRRIAALCALAPILMAGPAHSDPPPPGFPVPVYKSAAEYQAELRQRFARVDSADVSRACGNLFEPSAYRGPSGQRMALRSYGRRHGGRDWAETTARLLVENAKIDTTMVRRRDKAACDPDGGPPVFLANFFTRSGPTLALMSFDEDFVLFFNGEGSLGHFRLGDGADSLWAALGSVLDTDPLLRGPRPRVAQLDTLQRGYDIVDELPEPVHRQNPVYPIEAREQDVSGTVWVQALVGEDGKVHDAWVASGPAPLRDAALEAVWQWEFTPAIKGKKPMSVWVFIPVKFSLH